MGFNKNSLAFVLFLKYLRKPLRGDLNLTISFSYIAPYLRTDNFKVNFCRFPHDWVDEISFRIEEKFMRSTFKQAR